MIKNLKYKIGIIFALNLIILLVIFLFLKKKDILFIKFNLITSTHTDLPWEFTPINPPLKIKIGELTNIEYIVKNLSSIETSGIASFALYPKELKPYIIKIDCFCYDIQKLKAGETKKFVLTMMIDPKVTKDSKTNSVDEAIMQFIFFDSKNFKKKVKINVRNSNISTT